MEYFSVKETAEQWEISERRVQKLCGENRIEGVIRFGHIWMIPKSAAKPKDMRLKSNIKKNGARCNDKAD